MNELRNDHLISSVAIFPLLPLMNFIVYEKFRAPINSGL